MQRSDLERDVVIVVFDGVKLLDAVGPAEVFAEANRFGARYRLRFVSVDGGDVTTSLGTRFAVCAPMDAIVRADTVLVAGGDGLVGQPIDRVLVECVRGTAGRTRRLASVCTGAFVLAEAGLLDDRRATTHWRHASRLSRAFPKIRVDTDAIFVRDGNVFTSAGVTAGIDLALGMIELDHGDTLVRDVARSLVVYLKRAGGQSQFSVLLETAPSRDSALRNVIDFIVSHPAEPHTVSTLAARASISTRQLTRLFHSELNITPARYVEQVRIDVARAFLDAGQSVGASARLAGFNSTETFRRAFKTHHGVSPKTYRERFRTTI